MREPQEWKSEVWWRHRPVEERLSWLHVPPRIIKAMETIPTPLLPDFDPVQDRYITGGRGKSVLAAQILQRAVAQYQVSGRWVDAETYVQMLKDSFDNENGQLGDEYSSPFAIKNIKAIFDVLVIDGLGDERKTEFAAHEIGSLIRGRYDRCRTTIITSRLSIGDIKARYGERLSAPMSEFDVEVLSGR